MTKLTFQCSREGKPLTSGNRSRLLHPPSVVDRRVRRPNRPTPRLPRPGKLMKLPLERSTRSPSRLSFSGLAGVEGALEGYSVGRRTAGMYSGRSWRAWYDLGEAGELLSEVLSGEIWAFDA